MSGSGTKWIRTMNTTNYDCNDKEEYTTWKMYIQWKNYRYLDMSMEKKWKRNMLIWKEFRATILTILIRLDNEYLISAIEAKNDLEELGLITTKLWFSIHGLESHILEDQSTLMEKSLGRYAKLLLIETPKIKPDHQILDETTRRTNNKLETGLIFRKVKNEISMSCNCEMCLN